MPDLSALANANASRWARMQLRPEREHLFDQVAIRLCAPAAKARYQAVSRLTGVPWSLIAVIHERECSQDWMRSIAQGDRWDGVSVHVPAGRGPFTSWERAAGDALANCPPFAAHNTDWTVGGVLALLERYNGLGYFTRGLPSPYIWAGTDRYTKGKYVRDGVFDPEAVDQQLGCAGMLRAMMALDPTITFTGAVLTPVVPKPAPTSAPVPAPAAPPSGLFGLILSIIRAIFGRK